MLALEAIVASTCFVFVTFRPAYGAYILLFSTPLIAGIARSSIPLRPNEAVLLVVLVALGVRAVLLMLSGRYHSARFDRMDLALLLLAAASSAVPLLWLLTRGDSPSRDDLLYSLVLIKYYLLFRVFRSTIVTTTEVMICLWLSLSSAFIEAVIAMLQVLNLFGIPDFLLAYYDQPFEPMSFQHMEIIDRGTSTLASSFGHADLMIMNLIIALSWYQRQHGNSRLLLLLAAVFLAGCIVSGEFSSYIGLVVALLSFSFLAGAAFRRILPFIGGTGALIAIPFWPVLANRFEILDGDRMPQSWSGRLENLQHFFVPKLMDGANWLLGVQPAPRVVAPEVWRKFVYIESGYVWLLWIGGVPLLLAFIYFVTTALTTLRQIARAHEDCVGVAASAAFCYVVTLTILMMFDPHLTLRGSADLLFPLIAISLGGQPVPARWSRQTQHSPVAYRPLGWEA